MEIICQYCNSTFNHKQSFTRHIKKFHQTEPVGNDVNNVANIHNLQESNFGDGILGNRIGENNAFKCTYCNTEFRYKKRLQIHIRRMHTLTSFVNTPYEKYYVQSETFIDGQSSNAVEYKCLLCGKNFSKKGYMTNHIKNVHDTTFIYDCTICNLGFQTQVALKKHNENLHSVGQELQNDIDYAAKNCSEIKKVSEEAQASLSRLTGALSEYSKLSKECFKEILHLLRKAEALTYKSGVDIGDKQAFSTVSSGNEFNQEVHINTSSSQKTVLQKRFTTKNPTKDKREMGELTQLKKLKIHNFMINMPNTEKTMLDLT